MRFSRRRKPTRLACLHNDRELLDEVFSTEKTPMAARGVGGRNREKVRGADTDRPAFRVFA